MGSEICVDRRGLEEAGASLQQDARSSGGYRLRGLAQVVQGAGSADHDGRLAALVARSFAMVADMTASDACRIRQTGERFWSEDEGLAARLMDS